MISLTCAPLLPAGPILPSCPLDPYNDVHVYKWVTKIVIIKLSGNLQCFQGDLVVQGGLLDPIKCDCHVSINDHLLFNIHT